MFNYLRGRMLTGVEFVEGNRYLRTVAIDKNDGQSCGWIVVEPIPEKHLLQLEVSPSLAESMASMRARVERLFDLLANPQRIAASLGVLATGRLGLRVPGAFNGFEIAVRAILGQQISVKSATTVACRFATAFGEPAETPFPQLIRLTPTPERVAQAEIGEIASLGIIAARSKSILALAEAVASGKVILEPNENASDVAETIVRLKELPGIGEWTAQYIAMRALSWPDAFPHTDLGIYKALGETRPKQVLQIAEAWRPWRAYAVMHLWKSLEEK